MVEKMVESEVLVFTQSNTTNAFKLLFDSLLLHRTKKTVLFVHFAASAPTLARIDNYARAATPFYSVRKICIISPGNHYFTVSTCSVSQKYRLLLREVLRERFLRETKKGLFAA